MTALKIEGKPATAARDGIEAYVAPLYATPGRRLIGIVELEHIERTEPAPGSDREAAVRVRMSALEIANPDQENTLRQALTALYTHRTAYGKLTEDGDIELAQSTLERCAGMLHAVEAARLRIAVSHWRDYAQRVAATPNAAATELKNELSTIADGLTAVLRATEFEQSAE